MKFYLYDKDTKEYQCEQLGYIDPLETELRGENVYLIPPYSTDIKPNLSELKSIMQSKRDALTCEYNNDVFDCNEQAQSNMTSQISFANLGMKEFSIRSTNEHTHTFTSAQLVELATLMSKTVNDLYSEYWDLKNALYECKTKEEIDKIEW